MAAPPRPGGEPAGALSAAPARMSASPRRMAAVLAVASVAVTLSALALTVHFNRAGHWDALYCHGRAVAVPPALAAEDLFLFQGTGFDGQFYHFIAHDPFFRRGFARYVDDPRLRYRRGLVPAAAHVLALGSDRWVHLTYPGLILLAVAAGVFWLARLASDAGRHPAWGLAFLLMPGVIASLDRMLPDVALIALTAGYLRALQARDERLLWTVLALAPLARETGVLLVAATILVRALGDRPRRGSRYLLALLPFLAWTAFVHAHAGPQPYEHSAVPMADIVAVLLHPRPYAGLPGAPVHQVGDVLAVAGMLWAFVLVLARLRDWRDEGQAAGLLFVVLGLVLQRPDQWDHVFSFGRIYSPVLLLLLRDALLGRRRLAVALAPTALTLSRVATQLGSQAVGVARGLLA